jgi:hypothetical protein
MQASTRLTERFNLIDRGLASEDMHVKTATKVGATVEEPNKRTLRNIKMPYAFGFDRVVAFFFRTFVTDLAPAAFRRDSAALLAAARRSADHGVYLKSG